MDINKISNRTIFRILAMIVLFVGLIWIGFILHRQLVWLASALFLSLAINPFVSKIAKYMPHKRRGYAVIIVFLVIIAIISFIGFALGGPLISQSKGLIHDFPSYIDKIQNSTGIIGENARKYNLKNWIDANQSKILAQITLSSGSIAKSIFNSVAATITVIALTIFMLLEGPILGKKYWNIQGNKSKKHLQNLAERMYQVIAGYVTGNLVISLIAAVATAIMMIILGVPYAIPLGLMVGIFDLIPIFGATLAAILVVIVSLFVSWEVALIMTIFFLVYQQTENHILSPIIYGKSVSMPPLLVMISGIIGLALGGFLGALIAIPVGSCILILIEDYLEYHLGTT